MRLGWVVVCLLSALLGVEPLARAEAAAGLDFAARATKQAQRGDHRAAIELLKKAFEADPSPDYLLQTAQQYELLAAHGGDLGDVRLAISYYRKSLATEKNTAQIRWVGDRVTQLEKLLPAPPPGRSTSPPPAPTEAPLAGEPVPVHFTASDVPDSYYVSGEGRHCTTPCTLLLHPGARLVTTTGSGQLKLHLDVPTYAGRVLIPSSGAEYLAPGIILTVVGAVMATALWPIGLTCAGIGPTSGVCLLLNIIGWPVVGGTLFFTGIGFLAWWGIHHAATADVKVSSDPAPPIKLTFLGLQPLRNGAAAGVGFSY